MVQERKNRLMAYRVERGLIVQKTVSTRAAAAYLANYGVPMHVSMRVLSTPNRRDMAGYDHAPFWFDIIRDAGPTYGAAVLPF
jgi:hypothetical protein